MGSHVLDASALLALLNNEQGADFVQELLPDALISSVNLAEVVTRLSVIGMPEGEIRDTLAVLGLNVAPFDKDQAMRAGLFYQRTHRLGLSLGDRACLALADAETALAVTADRVWGDLDLNVEVKLIR